MTIRRFTVMGFTEAELGFVLAAVFAALAVSGLSSQPENLAAKNDSLAHRIDSVSRRADSVTRKMDSVSAAFASYRDSVRKRSNKTPRCSEKGEPPEAIAEVRILGRDRYELAGARMTFRELESQLAAQIARSNELRCHYLVRTIATAGVDSTEHSAAVAKLWSHFDVNERQR